MGRRVAERRTGEGGAEGAMAVRRRAAAEGMQAQAAADARADEGKAEKGQVQRWASFRTRFISGVCLMAGFVAAIASGHLYVWLMILVIQTVMVHELFALAYQIRNEKRELPWFRTLQWWFFMCAVIYVHGRFLIEGAHPVVNKHKSTTNDVVRWCVLHHTFVSYVLYITGFVIFVLTLKKRLYMEQFVHFAWIHMTLLVVFAQSSFFVSNVLSGLVWFVLPSWLVIWNDVQAYLFGKAFGRTRLLALSPNKTLEGFVGALVMTLLVAPVTAEFLKDFRWMTCPATSLSYFRDKSWLNCDLGAPFLPVTVRLDFPPTWVVRTVPFPWVRDTLVNLGERLAFPRTFEATPLHLHSLVLALFAALIAPFGGFFASGLKRAFRIKDFGASIPGHGGLTDRMDCQVVMAMFTYIYYQSFVETAPNGPCDTAGVWATVNEQFTDAERRALYDHLGELLGGA